MKGVPDCSSENFHLDRCQSFLSSFFCENLKSRTEFPCVVDWRDLNVTLTTQVCARGDVGFTSFWNSLYVGILQHRGTYRLQAAAVLCARKDIKVMPVVGMSQPGQFYITFREVGDKSPCSVKTVNFLTRWLTTDCRTCPQKVQRVLVCFHHQPCSQQKRIVIQTDIHPLYTCPWRQKHSPGYAVTAAT
jgi:hypothetical protein